MAERVNLLASRDAGQDAVRRRRRFYLIDALGGAKCRTFSAEFLNAGGVLGIKFSERRRAREDERLELMHLDVGEEVRVANVRFPRLFDAFGLFACGQAACLRFLMTWKKCRQRNSS